jgi:hypothetical protein
MFKGLLVGGIMEVNTLVAMQLLKPPIRVSPIRQDTIVQQAHTLNGNSSQ